MAHTILNREECVTVTTEVLYVFPDGSEDAVSVAHFNPQSEEEILQNIENRYQTELLIRGE